MSNRREEPTQAGVAELISRLRDEGVAAGEREAGEIVTRARLLADELVNAARLDADALVRAAREQANRETRAAQEALRLAARDALLAFREAVVTAFAVRLRSAIGTQLAQPAYLAELVRLVLQDSLPGARQGAVLSVPDDPAVLELVRAIAAEMLADGVTVLADPRLPAGVRCRLHEGRVEIDASEESLSELLGRHLGARFRQLLERPAPG